MSDQIGDRTESGGLTQTVLGAQKVNPYTVQNMALAHNELYGTFFTQMPTTHLYIKFLPATFADLATLDESEIVYFDFPLDYEIIEMGDKYFSPSSPGELPNLWSVIEVGDEIPAVPYEILASLYLDESDMDLIAKAFDRTGNEWEGDPGEIIDCLPGDPNYPYCLCQPWWEYFPDCESPEFDWSPFEYNPPPPPKNDCGCNIPPNPKRPAGCIQVEDTELGMQGVRDVKVIWWNGWFNINTTHTSGSGCWEINKTENGKAYMWVRFKNGKANIRGSQASYNIAAQYLFAVTHFVGQLSSPFNNIKVEYMMYTDQGSKAHRLWSAATVINAIDEFHDYTSSDGIATPPPGLNVLLMHWRTGGAAIMAQNIGASNFFAGIFEGLFESANDFFIDDEFENTMANFVGTSSAAALAAVMYPLIPDVMVGSAYPASDRLKNLAYHEFTHASHFMLVGPTYWQGVIAAETPVGHGTSSDPNAPLIAIVESWAESLGMTYTDRTYGANNSIFLDWEQRLERTLNESANHIPVGFHHDLVDPVNNPENPCSRNQDDVFLTGPCIAVRDGVAGFTLSQLFSQMTASSPAAYVSGINTNLVPGSGNTATQVNVLFSDY